MEDADEQDEVMIVWIRLDRLRSGQRAWCGKVVRWRGENVLSAIRHVLHVVANCVDSGVTAGRRERFVQENVCAGEMR